MQCLELGSCLHVLALEVESSTPVSGKNIAIEKMSDVMILKSRIESNINVIE